MMPVFTLGISRSKLSTLVLEIFQHYWFSSYIGKYVSWLCISWHYKKKLETPKEMHCRKDISR